MVLFSKKVLLKLSSLVNSRKISSSEGNRQWHHINDMYSHYWLFTYPLVWAVVFIRYKAMREAHQWIRTISSHTLFLSAYFWELVGIKSSNMGLISFIVNNKQLCELEEVIPILWDKINSFYMTKIRSNRFNYTDTPMGNLNLRNKYGNGKIIKPQNDLPDYLQAKMREFMKEEGLSDGGEMFVIKSSDYNYFMMSLAEFSKKSNSYIQLMKKSSLQLSTNMNNIFRAYQNVVENMNHKYIYVVE